jgi:phosphotriesterase-related protein
MMEDQISFQQQDDQDERKLITTLGARGLDELGMILPHEHIFVDLRTWDQPGFAEADPTDVIALMGPEIARAKAAGITALVECSTVGVGRRVDILKAVSDVTDFPLLAPTGLYREPWIPPWAHAAGEDELSDWMLGELQEGIKDSGVKAGWIKLSAGDDGMTSCEAKVLRAATRAGVRANAVIGSHTVRGSVVLEQIDILENAGYAADRFIWIHTQAEPNQDLHLEVARRGAWIEYDWIGGDYTDDQYFVERIVAALDAGLGNRLLISHDRGWFDPALPGGGTPKPFTYISNSFLPKLRAAGVDDESIQNLTRVNPFQAFAR